MKLSTFGLQHRYACSFYPGCNFYMATNCWDITLLFQNYLNLSGKKYFQTSIHLQQQTNIRLLPVLGLLNMLQ